MILSHKAGVVLVTGSAASLLLWLNRKLFTVNDVTAGRTQAYPGIQPHEYDYAPPDIFALAEAVARDMAGWRVLRVDRVQWNLDAQARIKPFPLLDDVNVRVNARSVGSGSVVVVRSKSRFGVGDLGENARRIRAFYKALDCRILRAGSRPPNPSEILDCEEASK